MILSCQRIGAKLIRLEAIADHRLTFLVPEHYRY